MKNPLLINRLNLKPGRQHFHQELTAEQLDIKALTIIGNIIVDLELSKNGDTITVEGLVSFKVKLNCVNCLEDFEQSFSEKVYQEYIRGSNQTIIMKGRLEDVDFMREYYSGDFFDLTGLIHDTIHLAIPIAPWCQENCPGVKV
ncbi:MAG: DUF177 domain-containing protein [candidate division WOR-3 bacterium]|nr:DUF177 domain-containing protein [candidate division WOR-3 bacterium]